MKITEVKDNLENKIRSILLDDGHFLFKLKKKSTSSTWSYFDIKSSKGISTRHKSFVCLRNATTGITLVSLVITIIILLILAGITINLTLGEHGIINMAKQAGKNYMDAEQYERNQLNTLNQEFMNQVYGIGSYDTSAQYTNFKQLIANAITAQGVETTDKDTDETIIGNIDKILQARTKDATATADDIAQGKTAYVNGELLTGIANIEKNWTLVIEYNIWLGWNGNYRYGSRKGKITIKNVNGNRTVTSEGGLISSGTETWNGQYYINACISDVVITSFTFDD